MPIPRCFRVKRYPPEHDGTEQEEPDPDYEYERAIESEAEREQRIEAEARHVTGEEE